MVDLMDINTGRYLLKLNRTFDLILQLDSELISVASDQMSCKYICNEIENKTCSGRLLK